jgi:putative membrane protein
MIHALSSFTKTILRLLLLWAVDGLSLLVTAAILPGFALEAAAGKPVLVIAFSVAFLQGIGNLLIRPDILLLAKPFGFIGEFAFGFFVNAIALGITAWLLPGFQLDGVPAAVVGGLIFSTINTILTGILDVGEEGSFYQNRIERLAKKLMFKGATEPGRGLVMVEIDGLSFHHLQRVLADGKMPALQRMIAATT